MEPLNAGLPGTVVDVGCAVDYRSGERMNARACWVLLAPATALAWPVEAQPAAPAQAQSALERGFEGALRGCEEWVLRPASWSQGFDQFVAVVGLGDSMGLVDRVDQANLPPEQFRIANHYWRINSTPAAGYVLVVSDRVPMCHITGGGDTDLRQVVDAVLATSAFRGRWTQLDQSTNHDTVSTRFRNVEEPKFSVTISRAADPGGRLDRVQVLATAIYDTGH